MEPVADADTQAVMALLRRAVASSGLTQAAFARAVGTSGSRFSTYLTGSTRPSGHLCMRAQRLAGALSAAAAQGLMSAPVTALVVREQLQAGDAPWAWRMLLQGRDHLRLLLREGRHDLIAAWEAAPSSTGSVQFDALLAAVAQREFERAHCVPPGWTLVAPLDEPWLPEHPFLTPERVRASTPDWLRQLNIFVPSRDLVTA